MAEEKYANCQDAEMELVKSAQRVKRLLHKAGVLSLIPGTTERWKGRMRSTKLFSGCYTHTHTHTQFCLSSR